MLSACGGGSSAQAEAAQPLPVTPTQPSVPPAEAPTEAPAPVPSPTRTFSHPGIVFTRDHLDAIKSRLTQDPWKAGYAMLASNSHSSLSYQPLGPFKAVSRNPDMNLDAYKHDMMAASNLTLMWYFTDNTAYASKAREILLAWATVQKEFSGAESSFAIGDAAIQSIGSAEILRSTYSGWTDDDTQTFKDYLDLVYWPSLFIGGERWGAGSQTLGGGQGALQIWSAMAVAVFSDDTVKYNMALNAYLTDPASGFSNTLPNGQAGDTGRDQGHAFGQIANTVYTAETLWAQGSDAYAYSDNRLLSMMEYYADFNSGGSRNFIPYGPTYGLYTSIGLDAKGRRTDIPASAGHLIYNAYVNRKGVSAPYLSHYRTLVPDYTSGFVFPGFIFRRVQDNNPKRDLLKASWEQPTANEVPSLVNQGIGSPSSTPGMQSAGDSLTLTGSGVGIEKNYQFASRMAEGDFTFQAKVKTSGTAGSAGRAGIMIRKSADASPRTPYVALTMSPPGTTSAGVRLNWRRGSTTYYMGYKDYAAAGEPYWIKLVRRGNFIYGFTSADGVSWSPTYSVVFPAEGDDSLGSKVLVGAFNFSGSVGETSTARFEDVRFGSNPSSLPLAPTALSANPSAGKIDLTWKSDLANVVYFDVYRASGDSDLALIATEVNSQSFTDTDVRPGTNYRYAVRASGYSGESASSETSSATGM